MPTPHDQDLPWEREVIEKLLLQKRSSSRRKFWLVILIVIALLLWGGSSYFFGENDQTHKPHIATLNLTEEISDFNGTLDKMTAGLEEIYSHAGEVQAIIIKANSPGGSPVISDTIFREIKRYQKLYPKIPIYTVVEDLCASGCYYIAAASDKIYANPASIVGSIGVIMPDYDLTALANKLGVKDRTKTAGVNKAVGNPLQPETPEQIAILKSLLTDVHELFITSVKEGRGTRLAWQDHPDLFSGRVYSGRQGKEVGLIDDFGSVSTVARTISKNPVLIDYTREEDWYRFAKKRLGMQNFKEWVLQSLSPTLNLR